MRINWAFELGMGLIGFIASFLLIFLKALSEVAPAGFEDVWDETVRQSDFHLLLVGLMTGLLLGLLLDLWRQQKALVVAAREGAEHKKIIGAVEMILECHLNGAGGSLIPAEYLESLHQQVEKMENGLMVATDLHPPQSWVSFYLFRLLVAQNEVYRMRRARPRGRRVLPAETYYYPEEIRAGLAKASKNLDGLISGWRRHERNGQWSLFSRGLISEDRVRRRPFIVEALAPEQATGVIISRIAVWPRYFFVSEAMRRAVSVFAEMHECVGIPVFWIDADFILSSYRPDDIHFVLLRDTDEYSGWVAPERGEPNRLVGQAGQWEGFWGNFQELLAMQKLLLLRDAVQVAETDWQRLFQWYDGKAASRRPRRI